MTIEPMIGRVYEAAALPERWPDVLNEITAFVSAAGCTLIGGTADNIRWLSSPGMHANVEEYFASGWAFRNDRILQSEQRGYQGLMRDIDLFTRDQIEAMSVVREFLRPRGLGWGAGLSLPMPTGERVLFSVEKNWASGPLSDADMGRLELIRPHLSRAGLLTAHLRFERAKAAVDALGLTEIPAAILKRNGSVLACNSLFEALQPQLTIGAEDRLILANEKQATALRNGLELAASGSLGPTPLSIALPARETQPAVVLHVIPSRGLARDIFSPAIALVIVSRLSATTTPAPGLLVAMFDLTPAESRVACELLNGLDSAEIASKLNISAETLRNHVKRILGKSGTNRRIEFVRMMASIRL